MSKSTAIATTDGNTFEAKAVEIFDKAADGVMINGTHFNVIGLVNLPTLKQETGEVVAIRLDAPIRQEVSYKEEEVVVDGKKTMATKEVIINVVRVTELGSMQPFEYVCNAITADNMRGAYPDNGYVGRCFAIKKLGLVAGKRYKDVQIVEIEPVLSAEVQDD